MGAWAGQGLFLPCPTEVRCECVIWQRRAKCQFSNMSLCIFLVDRELRSLRVGIGLRRAADEIPWAQRELTLTPARRIHSSPVTAERGEGWCSQRSPSNSGACTVMIRSTTRLGVLRFLDSSVRCLLDRGCAAPEWRWLQME